MANDKPRLMITLTDEGKEAVLRFSKARKTSQSRVIMELIHEIAPMLNVLSQKLEEAERLVEEANTNKAEILDSLDSEMSSLMFEMTGVKLTKAQKKAMFEKV